MHLINVQRGTVKMVDLRFEASGFGANRIPALFQPFSVMPDMGRTGTQNRRRVFHGLA